MPRLSAPVPRWRERPTIGNMTGWFRRTSGEGDVVTHDDGRVSIYAGGQQVGSLEAPTDDGTPRTILVPGHAADWNYRPNVLNVGQGQTRWDAARHRPTGLVMVWSSTVHVWHPFDTDGLVIDPHVRTASNTLAVIRPHVPAEWLTPTTDDTSTTDDTPDDLPAAARRWLNARPDDTSWDRGAATVQREYVIGGETPDDPLTSVYLYGDCSFRIYHGSWTLTGRVEDVFGVATASYISSDGFERYPAVTSPVMVRNSHRRSLDGLVSVTFRTRDGAVIVTRPDANTLSFRLGLRDRTRLYTLLPGSLAEREVPLNIAPPVDWAATFAVDNPTTVGYDQPMPATATLAPTVTGPARTLRVADVVTDMYWQTVMDMEPSLRHLDHQTQSWIYILARAGYTQASIANVFGLTTGTASRHAPHHATAHAIEAYCARTGNERPTRRNRRRVVTDGTTAAPLTPVAGTGLLILGRAFGVEVEYNGRGAAPYVLSEALRDAGLAAEHEDYNHATRTWWKCTTDASVSGGECVSPILSGSDAMNDVRTVMQTISRLGSNVGNSCGTHVHHNVNDFDREALRRLVINLGYAHYALLNYVLDRRLGASYVSDITQYHYNRLLEYVDDGRLAPAGSRSTESRNGGYLGLDRYVVFNFNSVLTYGTVEFRAHQGTLNATKLEAWVGLGQAIVEYSRRGGTLTGTITTRELVDLMVGEGLLHRRLGRRVIDRVTALHGADRLDRRRVLSGAA